MTLLPRSLTGRLLAGGAILIGIAVIVAAIAIGLILQRFVVGQIDQRLDSTINDVAAHLSVIDGNLALSARGEAPDFMRPNSGWYWQAQDQPNSLHSQSLQDNIEVDTPKFDWRMLLTGNAIPAHATGRHGEDLHGRMKTVSVGGKSISIVATAPQAAIVRPLWEALSSLLLCLGALAAALLGGLLLQVRIGLRPLRHLQAKVSDVISGHEQSVPADQPTELSLLAGELNTLIAQNRERLQAARLQSANLAHSLKTPLAALSLATAEIKRPELHALVEKMQANIKHHLGRARSSSKAYVGAPNLRVRPQIEEMVHVLEKLNAARQIAYTIDCPADLIIACDASDFTEMMGNLLDNAFKWAKGEIRVRVRQRQTSTVFEIANDGMRLSPDQMAEIVQPGKRLDETVPGDGFGLAIVVDLAALYGGQLSLSASDLGGLQATITLPYR